MISPELLDPEPKTYDISNNPAVAKRKSVLILEDDGSFAGSLKQMLEDQGYQITVVPSGTEGLQQILAADFDAIVCDMVMPNFPGDMFYVAVHRIRPHLCDRFIFMTGHQSNPKISEFVQKSGRIVLWKPFELRALFNALEALTGRSK